MSRSPTIIDSEWLPNDHAGEMLISEFLQPVGMTIAELASAIRTPVQQVGAVVAGRGRMTAELDLRLTRYFGLS